MNKEQIEQAAKDRYPTSNMRNNWLDTPHKHRQEGFVAGATWQQSQSVEKSKPDITELIDIRNKLYNDLPAGEVNAWDLLQTIKWHINELDVYMSRVKSVTPAPEIKWVSVKDRLPDWDVPVLWISEDGVYQTDSLHLDGNSFLFPDPECPFVLPPITHWQPLPAPPLNPQDK